MHAAFGPAKSYVPETLLCFRQRSKREMALPRAFWGHKVYYVPKTHNRSFGDE
jgi:hypothetical protein